MGGCVRAQSSVSAQQQLAKVLEDAPDDGELESWRSSADTLLKAGGRESRTAAMLMQNAYLYGCRLRAALSDVQANQMEDANG